MASQWLFGEFNYLRLDLHGCSAAVAFTVSTAKLMESFKFGIRFLEIVHGHKARALDPMVQRSLATADAREVVESVMPVTMDFGLIRQCNVSPDRTGVIVVVAQNPERREVVRISGTLEVVDLCWPSSALLSGFAADVTHETVSAAALGTRDFAVETPWMSAERKLNISSSLACELERFETASLQPRAHEPRIVLPEHGPRPVYTVSKPFLKESK